MILDSVIEYEGAIRYVGCDGVITREGKSVIFYPNCNSRFAAVTTLSTNDTKLMYSICYDDFIIWNESQINFNTLKRLNGTITTETSSIIINNELTITTTNGIINFETKSDSLGYAMTIHINKHRVIVQINFNMYIFEITSSWVLKYIQKITVTTLAVPFMWVTDTYWYAHDRFRNRMLRYDYNGDLLLDYYQHAWFVFSAGTAEVASDLDTNITTVNIMLHTGQAHSIISPTGNVRYVDSFVDGTTNIIHITATVGDKNLLYAYSINNA